MTKTYAERKAAKEAKDRKKYETERAARRAKYGPFAAGDRLRALVDMIARNVDWGSLSEDDAFTKRFRLDSILQRIEIMEDTLFLNASFIERDLRKFEVPSRPNFVGIAKPQGKLE
jgi:hypothetical protein